MKTFPHESLTVCARVYCVCVNMKVHVIVRVSIIKFLILAGVQLPLEISRNKKTLGFRFVCLTQSPTTLFCIRFRRTLLNIRWSDLLFQPWLSSKSKGQRTQDFSSIYKGRFNEYLFLCNSIKKFWILF